MVPSLYRNVSSALDASIRHLASGGEALSRSISSVRDLELQPTSQVPTPRPRGPRDLFAPFDLRRRIRMPSLSEYSKAHRVNLISTIVAQFQRRAREDYEELQSLPEQNGTVVAASWTQKLERRSRSGLTTAEMDKLADLD